MIPLFTSSQIKVIDEETIKKGITSRELIFRASNNFVEWLIPQINQYTPIHVLCGNGNNGADGFLIAELLANRGYHVHILHLDTADKRSPENRYFLERLQRRKDISSSELKGLSDCSVLAGDAILIDALLGNGTDRPLEGFYYSLVEQVNNTYSEVFAVDCPSGLMAHEHVTHNAMHCTATFSFEFPKLSFFDASNDAFIGEWTYRSIGLDPEIIKSLSGDFFLLDSSYQKERIRSRPRFAHKGMMGKALHVISNQMLGAGTMAARACIRSGAGYTFTHTIDGENLLVSLVPESLHEADLEAAAIQKYDVLSIGPGLGLGSEALQAVSDVLTHSGGQLILDADALNIIARNNWSDRIPKGTILTPHIKEFERLFGQSDTHHQRVELQRKKSKDLSLYIILKGRYTSVTDPMGQLYYNASGNAALAKGGSGDILTGLIAGLCAQNYEALTACCLGVYLHGRSADLYVQEHHEMTMAPSDLLTYLPSTLKEIKDA